MAESARGKRVDWIDRIRHSSDLGHKRHGISSGVWRDEIFAGLSREAKLVALYWMTAPQGALEPGNVPTVSTMVQDIGLPESEVRAAITEAARSGFVHTLWVEKI